MNGRRTISTLFADDIRQELGNKFSLMGCYGDELLVDKIPTVLAKLCVFLKVTASTEKPLGRLVVRAKLNDEVIGEIEVPPQDLASAAAGALQHPLLAGTTTNVMLSFSPFSLTEPGALTVEAETEDGVISESRLILKEREGSSVAST